MTLRSRLALLFGLVALVASALVGSLAYRAIGRELAASTDDFLRSRSAEIEQGLRSGPRTRQGRTSDTIENAADDDSIIQFIGPNGRTVSTGAELPVVDVSTASSDGRFDDIEIDGESHRMVSRTTTSGATIQVARSIEEAERVLSRLVARVAFIALVVAALAAALGWFIAARATSPLRRLATAANDVAKTGDIATATDLADIEGTDEIGSLASSFRSMLDALRSSRAQQHQLIYDAGHELRTPLTSMRANIGLLERAPNLSVEQRTEVVAAIRSELVELSDLFDEMIDLATDQGDSMVFERVDLDAVVRAVAARWERRSGRTISVDSKPAIVKGDAAMLERAVSNLVSNGDKFGPPGTSIDIVAADGAVHVRDHGAGVAIADRSLIFNRFYRSEANRSSPGSGLGLSIVAQIVERHGGNVWVTDAPSGGADIGFRLNALADVSSASAPTVPGPASTR